MNRLHYFSSGSRSYCANHVNSKSGAIQGSLTGFQIKRYLYSEAKWGERARYLFKGIQGLKPHEIQAAPQKLCKDIFHYQQKNNYIKALKVFSEFEKFLLVNLQLTQQHKNVLAELNKCLTKQQKRSFLYQKVLKEFCGQDFVEKIREGFIEGGIFAYQNSDFRGVKKQWKVAQTIQKFGISSKDIQLKHALGICHFKCRKVYASQQEFFNLLNSTSELSKAKRAVIVNQIAVCDLVDAIEGRAECFDARLKSSRNHFQIAQYLEPSNRLYEIHLKIINVLEGGPYYGVEFKDEIKAPVFEMLEPMSILYPLKRQLSKHVYEVQFHAISMPGHNGVIHTHSQPVYMERKKNLAMLEKLDRIM